MMLNIENHLINYLNSESSIFYIIINFDDIIIYSNQYANHITGLQLVGRSIHDVFLQFGEQYSIQYYLKNTEKKQLVNIISHTNIPETYYLQFINLGDSALAIGEANNAEVELLRKNLLDLNHDLSNISRELHKRNSELKKLNDMKNNLLGIAAHDLRNPIGIIMAYSEFLKYQLEDVIDIHQVKMLSTINSTSEFLLHLLNELLDISAIESGKLTLNYTLIDLKVQIKQNIELNNIIAEKKNIKIVFSAFEDLPMIHVDSIKIEQVMNNLISNAIKFSFPNTIIRVDIFKCDNYIIVEVADQGQGIPEAEIEHIFKPFVKTSVKATGNESSTGLGLAIVKNIVIGHRGRIWVKSKVGEGTSFYFSLPFNL